MKFKDFLNLVITAFETLRSVFAFDSDSNFLTMMR